MFCPECATQNLEPAKFCRVCGTNLELVSLALAAEQNPTDNRIEQPGSQLEKDRALERKREGLRHTVQGSILLAVSALVAGVGFLVAKDLMGWLVLWSIFFGWIAVWGSFLFGSGLSTLLESKLISPVRKSTDPTKSISPEKPTKLLPPFSVTERTTRHLEERKTNLQKTQ
jgi:hypothetical protein